MALPSKSDPVAYLTPENLEDFETNILGSPRSPHDDNAALAFKINEALAQFVHFTRLWRCKDPSPAEVLSWREGLEAALGAAMDALGGGAPERSGQVAWVARQLRGDQDIIEEALRILEHIRRAAAVPAAITSAQQKPAKKNWPRRIFFRTIGDIFQETYFIAYAVSVRSDATAASGPALDWSRAVLAAAARAPAAPQEVAELGAWSRGRPEGVAEEITLARRHLEALRKVNGSPSLPGRRRRG